MSILNVLPELLTTNEAAMRLGISPQTLTNWRSLGRFTTELPWVKLGGAIRYKSEDVERVRQTGLPSPPRAATRKAAAR